MALACHVWVPQRFLDAWHGDFHLLTHVFWGQDVSTMQDTLTQVWKIGSWISEVICITNVKVTFPKLCLSLYILCSHISPLPSICRKRQDQFIGPHHKGISQNHSSDWLKCIVHHGKHGCITEDRQPELFYISTLKMDLKMCHFLLIQRVQWEIPRLYLGLSLPCFLMRNGSLCHFYVVGICSCLLLTKYMVSLHELEQQALGLENSVPIDVKSN